MIAIATAGDNLNLGFHQLGAHHDVDLIERAFRDRGIDGKTDTVAGNVHAGDDFAFGFIASGGGCDPRFADVGFAFTATPIFFDCLGVHLSGLSV